VSVVRKRLAVPGIFHHPLYNWIESYPVTAIRREVLAKSASGTGI
jgi:hypothetical protein